MFEIWITPSLIFFGGKICKTLSLSFSLSHCLCVRASLPQQLVSEPNCAQQVTIGFECVFILPCVCVVQTWVCVCVCACLREALVSRRKSTATTGSIREKFYRSQKFCQKTSYIPKPRRSNQKPVQSTSICVKLGEFGLFWEKIQELSFSCSKNQ